MKTENESKIRFMTGQQYLWKNSYGYKSIMKVIKRHQTFVKMQWVNDNNFVVTCEFKVYFDNGVEKFNVPNNVISSKSNKIL